MDVLPENVAGPFHDLRARALARAEMQELLERINRSANSDFETLSARAFD